MAPPTRTVCLFGAYDASPLYSRNAAVREALIEAGFTVTECRPSRRRSIGWAARRNRGASPLRSLWATAMDWLSLARQRGRLRAAEVVVVPYPSHADVFLARALRRSSQLLVMDAFLGLYETVVHDRRLVSPGSIRARLVARWEAAALRSADRILIDTAEQAAMLATRYRLEPSRLIAIPVGIDEALWSPAPAPTGGGFVVAFWGTFIPLHGADTVVRAAAILEQRDPRIRFRLVGDGQEADAVAATVAALRPGNLEWQRSLRPIEELRELACEANCVLGIFGDSAKAGAVIPYKVHQALASARPVVTREGAVWPATADPEPPVITVAPADPEALADALLRLATDPVRCRAVASAGRAYFDAHLSVHVMSRILGEALAGVGHQQ